MKSSPPTVADLLALKGKRQLTKLLVESLDEAAAANAAGFDMLPVPPEILSLDGFRAVCPEPFVVGGLEPGAYITEEDYLRAAFHLLKLGANAVYCGASLGIVRRLRDGEKPIEVTVSGPLDPALSRIAQQVTDSAILSASQKRTVGLLS